MSVVESFEYQDLNTIDPTMKPVDEGVYTLKILKAVRQTYVKNEKEGEFIKFHLAITNDHKFSGRRLFPTLFMSDFNLKVLRRIMDNTGVVQVPGTTLDEWLKSLTEMQPEFKTKVLTYEDRKFVKGDKGVPTGEVRSTLPNGEPAPVNAIDWREIHPA